MWKDLSLKDKSALMQIMVNNGIYDLSTIRDTYNKFAEGGYVREQNNNPVAFDEENINPKYGESDIFHPPINKSKSPDCNFWVYVSKSTAST